MHMSMGRCPWLAVTVWTWMLWMTWTGHGWDTHPRMGQRGGGGGVTEGDRPPITTTGGRGDLVAEETCLEKFSTPNSGLIFPINFNNCGGIFPILFFWTSSSKFVPCAGGGGGV